MSTHSVSYQRRTPSDSENKSVSFWQRWPKGCQYKITLLHLAINRKERLIRDNRLYRGLFSCTRVPRYRSQATNLIWFVMEVVVYDLDVNYTCGAT